MTVLTKLVHIAINVLYILILAWNVVKRENLVIFYFSVLIACIFSILLHELSHILFAMLKKYRIIYIRLIGVKIDFANSKFKFDAGSMALKGQVGIDYAACFVNWKAVEKTLKDIKCNFAVGALTTLFIFLLSTIMFVMMKGDIIFICFSWINFNMLLSACYKDSSIQDVYGYFSFENIREELIFIIFFQSTSSGTTTDYLYKMIRNNIWNKLNENKRLSKHDLNALIIMVSKDIQNKKEEEIVALIVENYNYYEYDNFILYFLLLCNIIIHYWKKMDLGKMYLFIINEKDFTSIIKVPIIGYRYMFFRMQYIVGGDKEKGKIWKHWDEARLGVNS